MKGITQTSCDEDPLHAEAGVAGLLLRGRKKQELGENPKGV